MLEKESALDISAAPPRSLDELHASRSLKALHADLEAIKLQHDKLKAEAVW